MVEPTRRGKIAIAPVIIEEEEIVRRFRRGQVPKSIPGLLEALEQREVDRLGPAGQAQLPERFRRLVARLGMGLSVGRQRQSQAIAAIARKNQLLGTAPDQLSVARIHELGAGHARHEDHRRMSAHGRQSHARRAGSWART